MYPHRIRLRGPWTCEPLFRLDEHGQRSNDNLPKPFRVTMPTRWSDIGLSEFRGGVRFLRPFGYPGRIDDFERVWLTFAGLDGTAVVTLNDQLLGNICGPAEFEITSVLRPHNYLTVDLESTAATAGLWGEVALEIRATAFLRDVHFDVAGDTLTAHGLVVGEASRPLDLYLLAGGRCLVYDQIEAVSAGQAFKLIGDFAGQARPVSVRVELVDAATIWYAVHAVVEPLQTNDGGESS